MTISKDAEGFWQSDQTPSELGGTMIVENWLLAASKIKSLEDADFQTEAQVNALISAAGHLALAGGTMLGALTLAGAPTVDLHAATKKYVDDNAGGGGSQLVSHRSGNIYGYSSQGSTTNYNNEAGAMPMLVDTTKVYTDVVIDVASGAPNVFSVVGYADDNGFPGAVLFKETQASVNTTMVIPITGNFTPTSAFLWASVHVGTGGSVTIESSFPLRREPSGWNPQLRAATLTATHGFKHNTVGATVPDPWTSTTEITSTLDTFCFGMKVQ